MKLFLFFLIIAFVAYSAYANNHCLTDEECQTWRGCYCDQTFHMCVCPQSGLSRNANHAMKFQRQQ